VKAVSKKRAALLRIYRKRRDEFMAAHPSCARCGQRSEELHHKAGRVGAALLDESRWTALCSPCHRWATEHPLDAIAEGYSLPRVGRAS